MLFSYYDHCLAGTRLPTFTLGMPTYYRLPGRCQHCFKDNYAQREKTGNFTPQNLLSIRNEHGNMYDCLTGEHLL